MSTHDFEEALHGAVFARRTVQHRKHDVGSVVEQRARQGCIELVLAHVAVACSQSLGDLGG